jgi:hypothetical protein
MRLKTNLERFYLQPNLRNVSSFIADVTTGVLSFERHDLSCELQVLLQFVTARLYWKLAIRRFLVRILSNDKHVWRLRWNFNFMHGQTVNIFLFKWDGDDVYYMQCNVGSFVRGADTSRAWSESVNYSSTHVCLLTTTTTHSSTSYALMWYFSLWQILCTLPVDEIWKLR